MEATSIVRGMCLSAELAYAEQARDDVTIVQQISLPIPADLAPGDYHIAMGFYEPDNFARLPVSPPENEHHYIDAWRFTVTE